MGKQKVPNQVKKVYDSLSKRAKIVVDHIVQHGQITTEELEQDYGYNHPPRAARDVREAGIPLKTVRVESSDGRRIAAYKFGDFSKIEQNKLGGRQTFPKPFKNQLYERSDGKCEICYTDYDSRYLQIDHRVPYEVAGDVNHGDLETDDYMLVCGSCNRAKSWSCEHCLNWQEQKSEEICYNCYWAYPDSYSHIALEEVRRMDVMWKGNEINTYEKLRELSNKRDIELPAFVKDIIKEYLPDE